MSKRQFDFNKFFKGNFWQFSSWGVLPIKRSIAIWVNIVFTLILLALIVFLVIFYPGTSSSGVFYLAIIIAVLWIGLLAEFILSYTANKTIFKNEKDYLPKVLSGKKVGKSSHVKIIVVSVLIIIFFNLPSILGFIDTTVCKIPIVCTLGLSKEDRKTVEMLNHAPLLPPKPTLVPLSSASGFTKVSNNSGVFSIAVPNGWAVAENTSENMTVVLENEGGLALRSQLTITIGAKAKSEWKPEHDATYSNTTINGHITKVQEYPGGPIGQDQNLFKKFYIDYGAKGYANITGVWFKAYPQEQSVIDSMVASFRY